MANRAPCLPVILSETCRAQIFLIARRAISAQVRFAMQA